MKEAKKWNTEHLLPKSRQGNNTPYNKRPCCVTCNTERGNKSYEYWLAELYDRLNNTNNPSLIYELEIKIENVSYWAHYVKTAGDKLKLPAAQRKRVI